MFSPTSPAGACSKRIAREKPPGVARGNQTLMKSREPVAIDIRKCPVEWLYTRLHHCNTIIERKKFRTVMSASQKGGWSSPFCVRSVRRTSRFSVPLQDGNRNFE
ncbi:hypothetical protein NPIL_435701 [Nephila pilipes]|uniref:Uncharacterized protein n=1 Tax=Nephila pilipes TaxID=299642 RepID=A0A8X6PCW4_NEPPI|nr:hypothetical protein NPIL_435701 [Nephila pilipes]